MWHYEYDRQPGAFPFPGGIPSIAPPGLPGGPGVPGMQGGTPPGPPPLSVPPRPPTQGFGAFAIDPGAIRPCRFRFVYLWLNNGEEFWAWLTFIGPRSAAGFRWTGRTWRYFGIDLNRIRAFQCY